METQEITAGAPVFAPDGTVRMIPNPQLPDAMAHGGKLAVQMKSPDGALRYVPHDQVGAAQQAGGIVNTEQGIPSDPKPKEGFWHSLGAVFGLTAEQSQAQAEYVKAHPFRSSVESTPGVGTLLSAPGAIKNLAKKTMEEDRAAAVAAHGGDIKGFLAHQIGGAGYAAATAAAPALGESPAKAGEQFGEGNIAGGLGTATGLLAPVVAGGAVKGKPVPKPVEIPNVYEGPMPSEIPAGRPTTQPGIVNRAATAVANAKLPPGANLIPKVTGAQKLAQIIASKTKPAEIAERPVYGNASNAEARGPYQPYQGDLTVTPFQQEVIAKAEGLPAPSGPSTLPRVASGEGVLNKALTSLDNKSLLKIAKSRGINVTQEAQLKPGAANSPLIKKIIDDFKPDELDEIRNMGMEISRNLPVQNPNITPEAAAEAWHYKVLNQFFPDVAVPKTMAARAQATIANRTFTAADVAKESFNRARAAAESKANAVPVDDLQGGHAGGGVTSVEELNRPGVNYVVSKSGQLTYQGKAFAPESAPSGATHVTVLPDGSFRVNAGPSLNAAQTNSLKFALKKQPWLKSKAGD